LAKPWQSSGKALAKQWQSGGKALTPLSKAVSKVYQSFAKAPKVFSTPRGFKKKIEAPNALKRIYTQTKQSTSNTQSFK